MRVQISASIPITPAGNDYLLADVVQRGQSIGRASNEYIPRPKTGIWRDMFDTSFGCLSCFLPVVPRTRFLRFRTTTIPTTFKRARSDRVQAVSFFCLEHIQNMLWRVGRSNSGEEAGWNERLDGLAVLAAVRSFSGSLFRPCVYLKQSHGHINHPYNTETPTVVCETNENGDAPAT